MPYKLQFKQEFLEAYKQEYLAIEQEFVILERSNPDFPKGKRFLTLSGTENTNTLIWECEFDSLDELYSAISIMEQSIDHTRLYESQKRYISRIYTSIFRSIES